MSEADIKPGDLVYNGKGTLETGAIVWRVLNIYQAEGKRYAVLASGMTERHATVPVERLRPFRPRLKEPAL